MRDVLHWFPYPRRIACPTVLVRRCTEGLAPPYLRELCCSTAYHSASYLIALFCPEGVTCPPPYADCYPTAWGGLPVALRLTPVAHSALFLSLFDRGWAG